MTNELTASEVKFQIGDTNQEVTMLQYFAERYKRDLDDKQPLLFINDRKNGTRKYLPAQLCNQANLPPDFTRDTRKMREIQQYKITSAQERMEKINQIVAKFQDDEEFARWGIALQTVMPSLDGHKLPKPTIDDGSGRTAMVEDFYNRRVKHLQPL